MLVIGTVFGPNFLMGDELDNVTGTDRLHVYSGLSAPNSPWPRKTIFGAVMQIVCQNVIKNWHF